MTSIVPQLNVLAMRTLTALCLVVAVLWPEWRTGLSAQGPDGVGYEPPPPTCSCQCVCAPSEKPGGSAISLSEGNLSDGYDVVQVRSAFGATLDFSLTYNSANADGSKMQVDMGLGFGWTHSYNLILFTQPQQPENFFRLDARGRVTVFRPTGDGTFAPSDGYFERLTPHADGTLSLREPEGREYTFGIVEGAHSNTLFESGPTYVLQRIADRNGNTTLLSYADGKLVRIEDAFARSLTLSYSNGKLRQLIDPANRSTTLHYDASATHLAEIRDPDGRSLTYSYNAQHQMIGKQDRDGRAFTYVYNGGKPVAIQDATGATLFTLANPVDWAIDADALVNGLSREYLPAITTETDGRARTWSYTYDGRGYVTAVRAPDGTATSYEYDQATLRPSARIDANGHATLYAYDDRGNLRSTTNALGHVTTYTYDPLFNQLTSATDHNGRVTSYIYDASGNRVREVDPESGVATWSYDERGNVLTETDKRGNVTRHTYDASGNRTTTKDALGRITSFSYDAVGSLIGRTDANGRSTSYVYDALDRLIAETDALGHTVRTVYDGEGHRLQAIDANQHVARFEYDARGRLAVLIDALGQRTEYEYDGNDNRTAITDANGQRTTYGYDEQNRLITVTDPLLHTLSHTYDAVGNLLTTTDGNGRTMRYGYDALNRQILHTDPLSGLTQLEYDAVGGCPECTGPTPGSSLVTRQIDANGKVTYFKYDGLDRRIRTIRKEGDTGDLVDSSDAVTSVTYDAENNPLSATEPNGNTTTHQYDRLNREVLRTNAAGDIARVTYDRVGNVASVTAPNGNVTRYTRDAADRVIRVSDSNGVLQRFTYDAAGNRLTATDGVNRVTGSAYDALDRLVRQTDPKGSVTAYAYDAVGNLLLTTDRQGQNTTHAYDAANRRVMTLEEGAPGLPAAVRVTLREYDAVGNLTRVVDPRGNATAYEYDALNRRILEQYPDATPNTRSYAYDPVGNLVARTDQEGRTTHYRYNDLYFLLRREYPVDPDDVFSYDLSGRLLTAERGGWVVTFSYDGADRLIETVQNGRSISYAYDVPRRTRAITYPGGRRLSETFDPRSRKRQVDDGTTSAIAAFTYDAADRVRTRSYRNGVAASYVYQANDWLTRVDHRLGTAILLRSEHAYDAEGNKLFARKRHDATASEAYAYDGLYRLVDHTVGKLVGATVPSPSTQTVYDLDALGNWNSKSVNGVLESRSHNEANEVTSVGARQIVHDANGNLVDDGDRGYAYDDENRLLQVTRKLPAEVLGEYQYDALGRRVRKRDNAGQETLYFYDDQRVVEEQDVHGATRATYVYGNYVDEVLTMERGGQTLYFHQNALFSVDALSDSNGVLVEGYRYDAYGRQTVFTPGANGRVEFGGDDIVFAGGASSLRNPYLFTGREYDAETGQIFYRARHYDPRLGRFLQRDPSGYADGLNLYAYVHDRPTVFTDPTGELSLNVVRGPDLLDDLYPSYAFAVVAGGLPPNSHVIQLVSVLIAKVKCDGTIVGPTRNIRIDYSPTLGLNDKVAPTNPNKAGGTEWRDVQTAAGNELVDTQYTGQYSKFCCFEVMTTLSWWQVKDVKLGNLTNGLGSVSGINGETVAAHEGPSGQANPTGSATAVKGLGWYGYTYTYKNPKCSNKKVTERLVFYPTQSATAAENVGGVGNGYFDTLDRKKVPSMVQHKGCLEK